MYWYEFTNGGVKYFPKLTCLQRVAYFITAVNRPLAVIGTGLAGRQKFGVVRRLDDTR